ncbi:MAG: SPFH domain-containing protein [Pseudomonadota bacterium]
MRKLLGTGDIEPQALPRYQLAARQERLLKKILIACVLLMISMALIMWYQVLPTWQAVLVAQTAGLLALTACLQSVWWITRWRVKVLKAAALELLPDNIGLSGNVALPQNVALAPGQTPQSQIFALSTLQEFSVDKPSLNEVPPGPRPLFARYYRGLRAYWNGFFGFIQGHGNSLATIGLSICAALALGLIISYWNLVPIGLATGSAENPNAGQVPIKLLLALSLVLLAFSALVLERYYAAANRSSELPESPHITYQLRVSITLSLLLCVAVLLANKTRQWPLVALVWVGLIPAAIAVELLMRAALSLFLPPPQGEPELLAESFLAALWRWPIKPFTHLQDELKHRFGIDLRQSWAFAYIRRAFLPVMATLLGVAWVLTGVTEIAIAERGIYERFGAPIAVWQPGLHLGLPWPLGKVQLIENGVVHELSAAVSDKDSTDQNQKLTTAEAPPPASANRLWDASHRAEKSQIIASQVRTLNGDRQSFHIVNMDVRFMYRIGMSDSAALKARYLSADTPALIRSTANRILVRYFASRTLEGVLGETRTQIARDIGVQLQADLDGLNSGVEIMTTVLEAIHPPAAAANAYHAVQAAQITAQAIIARERGSAAQQIHLAHLRADMTRNQANAAARETLASADVAKRRFIAERDAYQQGGKAFLLEQYFAQLTQGLANSRLVLVDHRLPAASATIDLRNFSGAQSIASSSGIDNSLGISSSDISNSGISAKTDAQEVSPALAAKVDYQELP